MNLPAWFLSAAAKSVFPFSPAMPEEGGLGGGGGAQMRHNLCKSYKLFVLRPYLLELGARALRA